MTERFGQDCERIEHPNLLHSRKKVHNVKSAQRETTRSAWNVDKKNIVVIIHGIIPKRKFFTSSSSNRAFQMFQSFKSGEIISTLYFHPSLSFWLDHFVAQLNKMWTLNFEMKFRNANM